MSREGMISIIDRLVHQNQLVAKKVQGTLIDKVYHRFLEALKSL